MDELIRARMHTRIQQELDLTTDSGESTPSETVLYEPWHAHVFQGCYAPESFAQPTPESPN